MKIMLSLLNTYDMNITKTKTKQTKHHIQMDKYITYIEFKKQKTCEAVSRKPVKQW